MTPSDAIHALQLRGMTEAAIGALVGAAQYQINRIKHGRDPRWSLGNDLIRLAQSHQRPRRNRTT